MIPNHSVDVFNDRTNPLNHMSGHNWEFDYYNNPWNKMINKTSGNWENLKTGHYRAASKEKRSDSLDIFKEEPPKPKEEKPKGKLCRNNTFYNIDKQIVDINSIYIEPTKKKLERNLSAYERKSPKKHQRNKAVSKTYTSNFKLGYSEDEIKNAKPFERKLSWKVDIEIKHEPVNVIGVSNVGYIRDSAVHARKRDSSKSNQRTFGSQVRSVFHFCLVKINW